MEDDKFVDVSVQCVSIDAFVMVMQGPDPYDLYSNEKVDIPFLRIEDVLNVPRWYQGVGERDLESVTDAHLVSELERMFQGWRKLDKEKLSS